MRKISKYLYCNLKIFKIKELTDFEKILYCHILGFKNKFIKSKKSLSKDFNKSLRQVYRALDGLIENKMIVFDEQTSTYKAIIFEETDLFKKYFPKDYDNYIKLKQEQEQHKQPKKNKEVDANEWYENFWKEAKKEGPNRDAETERIIEQGIKDLNL